MVKVLDMFFDIAMGTGQVTRVENFLHGGDYIGEYVWLAVDGADFGFGGRIKAKFRRQDKESLFPDGQFVFEYLLEDEVSWLSRLSMPAERFFLSGINMLAWIKDYAVRNGSYIDISVGTPWTEMTTPRAWEFKGMSVKDAIDVISVECNGYYFRQNLYWKYYSLDFYQHGQGSTPSSITFPLTNTGQFEQTIDYTVSENVQEVPLRILNWSGYEKAIVAFTPVPTHGLQKRTETDPPDDGFFGTTIAEAELRAEAERSSTEKADKPEFFIPFAPVTATRTETELENSEQTFYCYPNPLPNIPEVTESWGVRLDAETVIDISKGVLLGKKTWGSGGEQKTIFMPIKSRVELPPIDSPTISAEERDLLPPPFCFGFMVFCEELPVCKAWENKTVGDWDYPSDAEITTLKALWDDGADEWTPQREQVFAFDTFVYVAPIELPTREKEVAPGSAVLGSSRAQTLNFYHDELFKVKNYVGLEKSKVSFPNGKLENEFFAFVVSDLSPPVDIYDNLGASNANLKAIGKKVVAEKKSFTLNYSTPLDDRLLNLSQNRLIVNSARFGVFGTDFFITSIRYKHKDMRIYVEAVSN